MAEEELSNLDSFISDATGLPKRPPSVSSDEQDLKDFLYKNTGDKSVYLPTSPSYKYFEGVSPLQTVSKTIDLTNVYTDPLESYQDYDVQTNPFIDWNDTRAKNQSTLQKIAYGFPKMLSTGLGAIAENTIGVVAGLASVSTGGTYSNNVVGQTVDSVNEWMSENLPHYYTNEELDPDRSWTSSLGSANFWTDKFANGLGYLLGSIGTIYITGGSGLLTRTASSALKMGTAEAELLTTTLKSTGSAATKAQKLRGLYETSKIITSGTKLASGVTTAARNAKIINAVKHIEMGAMMSQGEAATEAREKSKEYIREAFSEWEENNPGKNANNDMTVEERDKIYSDARSIENATFAWNSAMLSITNLWEINTLFGGFKKMLGKEAATNSSIASKIAGNIDEGYKTANLTGFSKRISSVSQFMAPIIKGKFIESFQEGAQFFIGASAQEYYKNKYGEDGSDLAMAMNTGLEKTFGTIDGQESILLGALIGGVGGLASTTYGAEASKRKSDAYKLTKATELLNSSTFRNFKTDSEKQKESVILLQAIKAAKETGNEVVAEELMRNYIFTKAATLRELGVEDLGLQQIEDLKDLSDEEFAKRTGYDPTTPLNKQTIGGKNKIELIEEYKKIYNRSIELDEKIDSIIEAIDPLNTGLPQPFQSKRTKLEYAANRDFNYKLKSIMMQNLVTIDTVDGKIDENINILKRISPELANVNLDDLIAVISKADIKVTNDGKVILPKDFVSVEISEKEVEEKNKTIDKESEKIKNAFKIAYSKSENYDPIKKQEFKNSFNNLILYLKSRETAIQAFEDLMSSRDKRNFAIQIKEENAKAAKQENSKKEKDSTIGGANSTMDLRNMDYDSLTPDQKKEWQSKYKELEKEEEEYYKAFKDLSPKNIADIIQNFDQLVEDDPKKASAILKVVAEQKEKADKSKTKPNTETNLSEEEKNDIKDVINNSKKEDTKEEDKKTSEPYSVDVSVPDNKKTININRTNYYFPTSLKDAITYNEKGEPIVLTLQKVTNGQKVQFIKASDEKTFNELLEIIGNISVGSKTVKNISTEESIKQAQNFLKTFNEKSFDTDTTLGQDASLEMFKGAVVQLGNKLEAIINLIDQIRYSHDSANVEYNDIKEYTSLMGLALKYSNLNKTYTDIIASKLKATETLNAETVSNDIKSKDSLLTKEELEDINRVSQEIKEEINKKEAELEESILNADAESIEKISNEIEELNKKLQENENRKPSTVGEGVEDPERSTENSQKQEPGGEGKRDAEVPKNKKLGETLAENIRQATNNNPTQKPTTEDNEDEGNDIEDTDKVENENIESVMDLKLYVVPSEHKTQEVDGGVKIVVTEKGKPLSNPISFGVDIKQYLLGSDLVKNQEEDAVSFVIIEEGNDYWNKRKDEIPPKDYWKEIPIYLKVKTAEGTEEIVALLNRYNSDESINPVREEIYNALKNGKKVTATLESKVLTLNRNIANTVVDNKSSKSFFYDIPKGFDFAVAVIEEGGQNVWATSKGEIIYANIDNKDLGRIAVLVPNPNDGTKIPLILHTNNVTEDVYYAFRDTISQELYENASEIVGFNRIKDIKELIENENLDTRYNVYYDLFQSGAEAITFYHENIEKWVTINFEELSKLYNGESFKYKILDKVTDENNNEDISEFNESDGGEVENLIAKGYEGFEDSLKNSILSKKIQVDLSMLGDKNPYVSKITGIQYDSYIDYLTSSYEGKNIGIDVNGHRSILKTDIFFNEKTQSPFFNLTPKITKLKINDEVVSEQVTPTVNTGTTAGTFEAPEPPQEDTEKGTRKRRVPKHVAEGKETTEDTDQSQNLQDLIDKKRREERKERVAPEEEGDQDRVTTDTGNKITDLLIATEEEFQRNGGEDGMIKSPTGQKILYKLFDKTYPRTTTKIYPPFIGDEEAKKNFEASSFIGTEVGALFQKMIQKEDFSRPEFMSVNAFLGIKYNAYTFLKMLDKSKEEKIERVEALVYSNFPRFAGRIDILTKDKYGTRKIYDIKTGSKESLKYYDEDKYDAENQVAIKSKRKLHGAQLSLYAWALNNMVITNNIKKEGIVDKTGIILYMPVEIVKSEDGDPKKAKLTNVDATVVKKLKLSLDPEEVLNKNSKLTYKFETKKSKAPEKMGTEKNSKSETPKSKKAEDKPAQKRNVKAKNDGEYSYKSFKEKVTEDISKIKALKDFDDVYTERLLKVLEGQKNNKGATIYSFKTKEEAEKSIEFFKNLNPEDFALEVLLDFFEEDVAKNIQTKFVELLKNTVLEITC